MRASPLFDELSFLMNLVLGICCFFSGLFFGKKRASHPNMNNLLFGRRSSYASDANGQQTRGLERAYALCMNIKKTCESLALTEANELPDH